MKNRIFTNRLLPALISMFALISSVALAQHSTEDFGSEKYSSALRNIAAQSEGKLTEEDILHHLANPAHHLKALKTNSTFLENFFFLSPEIALVSFDGSESALFNILAPHMDFDLLLDFSNTDDWVDTLSASIDFDNEKITIGVFPNPGQEARSTSFDAIASFVTSTITVTAQILQKPAPQQFIFVSPNYFAASPEGGTLTATITHFNLNDTLEFDFDADWITVGPVFRSVSSVVITIHPNDSTAPREEVITIREFNNPEISDTLTIYQYGRPEPFLVASPRDNYVGPDATEIDIQIFSNIYWEASFLENPEGMFDALETNPDDGELWIGITQNQSPNSRTGKILISNTDASVTDTIRVYQAAAYIILNPRQKLAPCTANSFGVDVLRYGADTIGIESYPGWVTATIVSNDNLHVTVTENTTPFARTGIVRVNLAGYSSISDSLIIVQYSCEQPYIILSPDNQLAAWDDNALASPFLVVSNNTGPLGITVLPDDWLSANLDGDSLYISLNTNYSSFVRTAEIIVFDTENPEIADTVKVFQGGTLAWILVSPEFRSVSSAGGPSEPFTVLKENVDAWEVYFENSQPDWITNIHQNGSEIFFVLAANNDFQTREAIFQIRDISDTTRYDTAIIFQKAPPEPFLFLSPRQQQVLPAGNPFVNFNVTRVNTGLWEVDADSVPDWITINTTDQNTLSLNVSGNTIQETRMATIRIYDTDSPGITDSVYVYQFSALDTLLLAAPREQRVSHNGNDISFNIVAVNSVSWEVEESSLPDWIAVADISNSVLVLSVSPNETFATRLAMIRMFVSNQPHINDSVFVYQYSALDTFLLAAPREQLLSHQGSAALDFTVAPANVNTWTVDPLIIPPWISVNASGNELLSLNVQANESMQTRQALIRLIADGQPHIRDSVMVFQFARPHAYLIAAPRERRVAHSGDEFVDFEVTRVNVENWEFADTTPYDEWIVFQNIGDSIVRLNILENNLLESRQAHIVIQAVNETSVRDTIRVYQYSALDHYLLAAPREHRVLYPDTIVNFVITTVNISELWEIEIIEGNEWIQILASGNEQLVVQIFENDSLETRTAQLRLFVDGQSNAADTVSIYQYASPGPNLLVSPREQWVAHTGTDSLTYQVTAVNIENWGVVPGGVDWIAVNEFGGDFLILDVEANPLSETRSAVVKIFSFSDPGINDSVSVYQYSALNSYILAAPREQAVDFQSVELSFRITSVNVDNWVLDPASLPAWIAMGASKPDTLSLEISMNTMSESRMATIYIHDENNPLILDSVSVYQYAAPRPFILAAPREKMVFHSGNNAVNFDLTLVNVASWNAESAGADWITINASGKETLSLNISENLLLETRSGIVHVIDSANADIRDSVYVFQYSALDHYIIVEPREQMARRYSGDTLIFNVLPVNVSNPGFEVIDSDDLIDFGNSSLISNTLTIIVKPNGTPNSRQAKIRVFDTDRPHVSDTVSVYQNFPYIILRPAALDSIPWTDTIIQIHSYSNIAEYHVSKAVAGDWYRLSKDGATWHNDPLTLRGNDSIYMLVDTNSNAFLRRSSHLRFQFGSEIGNEFWFDQNNRPGIFFSVGGKILIQGDESQPLIGVTVAVYDSIRITDAAGQYLHDRIPENWIGTITPLIDTALAIPYYFLPPRIEISALGITADSILDNFSAYKIDPRVVLNPDIASICFRDTLKPGDPNYPSATISDTYGSSTYFWTSEPYDSLLAQNPYVLYPQFSPKVATTYRLEVSNFFRTAVDSFTIVVNQLPESVNFEGIFSVCRNQAGVIYQVPEPQPGIFYNWRLDTENPGGTFANSYDPFSLSGNIAIINWDNTPGNFNLTLDAYNEFGCTTDPVSRIIEITATEAPPASRVLRKENDNLLYATDTLANTYQWGWFVINESGKLGQEYIIPGKNEWYCRLPEGHVFNPTLYHYFVILYYDDNACGSRLFFNAPVGFEELQKETVAIFPNPNSGIFTVKFGSTDLSRSGSVEVYNTTGKLVYFRSILAVRSEEIIDLNHPGNAAKGLYLILIRAGSNVFSSKFIVQ